MKTPSKLVIIYLLSLCIAGCLGDFIHAKYKSGHSRDQVVSRRYMAEVSDCDRFLEYIKNQNIKVHHTIRNSFFNSISFEIKHLDKEHEYATLKSIMNHDDVEAVSPVHVYKRAAPATSQDMFKVSPEEAGYRSTHRLLQIDKVHRELNLTGEGVFIAIIDTGVDYLHPALGGGYGPGYTVQTGYDFVGNKYGSVPGSVPEPDSDPYDDCTIEDSSDGHGTSTSGIIGGYDLENNFIGVAYKAKLGVYRVFGCQGDSTTDIVYQAIDKAFADGADIISLSVGSDTPWAAPESYESKLFAKIKERGVIVVAATTNDGDLGIYSTSSPSTLDSVYSVGGVYNEYVVYDGTFTAAGISGAVEYQVLSITEDGTKLYMTDGDLSPSFNGTGDISKDACDVNNISPTVQGKIALVKRGPCSFVKKALNVASAGAVGIIVYDNEPVFSNEDRLVNTTIPYAFISLQDGERLASGNSTVRVKFSSSRKLIYKKNPYGGMATFYTGLGPTAELDLKPNILAVSEDVYTLLPRYLGSWTIFDGTSGATPLVAGSIALYLQYMRNKNVSVDTTFEQFQNYASVPVSADAGGGIDHPVRVGAGLIQVYDAITQTTHISPAQISFNDTASQDYKTQNLTITNPGQTTVSYRVFNNASLAIVPYDRTVSGYRLLGTVKTQAASADLAFSATEIHLEAGQSQTLTVTVTPPNTDPLDHVMYGGFIQLDPITNTTTTTTRPLHVPYFGVVGKQYDLPILDRDYNITVSQTKDGEWVTVNEYVIDIAANKTDLIIGCKTLTPTKIMRVEIFEDEKCTQLLGYAYYDTVYNQVYNHSPWVFTFRGTFTKDVASNIYDYSTYSQTFVQVPGGQYYIRQKFLKLFGDPGKENDWEYFTVGPVVIKR
ncbi:peptidase S8/S53 domain-containing protein [Helicostylum pulchrum]|nr:peptidase S8/S53 domain-containing protein [Helicostylum pulchrum]